MAGGGTGGHVYPSISVARALEAELRAQGRGLETLYIGIRGRVDEVIVPREGFAFRAISAGQLRVSSPLAFVGNVARLAWGSLQSIRVLRGFKPDVVFATGGYASVPVGVAARVLRRPLVVYLPDVTPGWAVRLLSRLATRMTTTSDRALQYLPKSKTTVVGYPVRGDFWSLDRETARRRMALPTGRPVLLVTGASLGAKRLNDAVSDQLPALLSRWTLLHVTGADDEARLLARRDGLPPEMRERYVVRGYLDDMPAALMAADLVVSRAGASSLGELPASGAPSVLVPGEYDGWSQEPNAAYLESEDAAVMLKNADLARLSETVDALLDDPPRLQAMSAAARRLARPDAARDIARILIAEAA
jgi:UDP-N-acetylglucosamine--N-acetylmuramyl-(pentapeptide) pyrophosphoryl-undecaprenol N-acetylglucosamine transferase